MSTSFQQARGHEESEAVHQRPATSVKQQKARNLYEKRIHERNDTFINKQNSSKRALLNNKNKGAVWVTPVVLRLFTMTRTSLPSIAVSIFTGGILSILEW